MCQTCVKGSEVTEGWRSVVEECVSAESEGGRVRVVHRFFTESSDSLDGVFKKKKGVVRSCARDFLRCGGVFLLLLFLLLAAVPLVFR